MKIRIGTRGSKLARIQAGIVKSRLENLSQDHDVHIKIIKTRGDRILDSPLARIDDKGLFVKEIEIALMQGKIDIGVHSLKDIPTEQPEELLISATPRRETANDAFVSNEYNSLSSLKPECTVGTSSLRRRSQLFNLRPDLFIKDIRGNMDTRLKKLDEGDYDALILACAGLKRLGMGGRITQLLPVDLLVPAVGQGALALEIRKSSRKILALCHLLNHEQTRLAVQEEREFLKVMGGGCQVPLGCHAFFEGNHFVIMGFICDLEGKEKIFRKMKKKRNEHKGSGRELASLLLENGGKEILETIRK